MWQFRWVEKEHFLCVKKVFIMENITTQVAEVAAQIELINLEDKLTIKALAEKLNVIIPCRA